MHGPGRRAAPPGVSAAAAGEDTPGGLAERQLRQAAGPERPSRRVLARHQGQRLDRRQGRGLGARPRTGSTASSRWRTCSTTPAQGQGQAITSITSSITRRPTAGSARSATTTPGTSPTTSGRSVRPVQGLHPVPGGDRRPPHCAGAARSARKKIDEVTTKTPLYSWARFRAADLVVSLYWLYDRTRRGLAARPGAEGPGQGYDWRSISTIFRLTTKTPGKKIDLGHARRQHRHGPEVCRASGSAGGRSAGPRCDLHDARPSSTATTARPPASSPATSTSRAEAPRRGPSYARSSRRCTRSNRSQRSRATPRSATGSSGSPSTPCRRRSSPTCAPTSTTSRPTRSSARFPPERVYASNGPDANLFGLEPNFGCCTANMHQGWPKFAEHLWMRTSRRRARGDRLCAVARRDAAGRQARCRQSRDRLSVWRYATIYRRNA